MSSSNSANTGEDDLLKRYTYRIPFDSVSNIPFVHCRVRCEGGEGQFFDQREGKDGNCVDDIQLLYGKQPAFHHPRTDWTHWDIKNPIMVDLADKDPQLTHKLQGVRHPYYDEPGAGSKFPLHAADCRDLMHDLIEKKMVKGQGLLALIRMASYGLENIISVARYQIQINSQTSKANSNFEASQSALPPTYERVECDITCGFNTTKDLRTHMYGKRFFIGIIHHGKFKHWTSFIWDRVLGHLYHFDSYLHDQVLRSKNVVYMWRELLAASGLPYDFDFFQPPITPQADIISCGPLSVFMIFRFLRGLVGCTPREMLKIHTEFILPLAGQPLTKSKKPPALLFSDWVIGLHHDRPQAIETKATNGLAFIKGFFFYLCLEDLGIHSGTVYQTKVKKDTGEQLVAKVTALYRNVISWSIIHSTGGLLTENLYTDFGGLMTIAPKSGVRRGWSHCRLMPLPAQGVGPTAIHGFMPQPKLQPTFLRMPPELSSAFSDRGIQFEGHLPMRSNVNVNPDLVVINSDSDVSQSKGKGKGKAVQAPTTPRTSDQIVPRGSPTPKASDQKKLQQVRPQNAFTPVNKAGPSTPINKPGSSSKSPLQSSPTTPVPPRASSQVPTGLPSVRLLLSTHLRDAQEAAVRERGAVSEDEFRPSSRSPSESRSSELSDYRGSNISNLRYQSDRMSVDSSEKSSSHMDIDSRSPSESRMSTSVGSEASVATSDYRFRGERRVRPRGAVEDIPPAIYGARQFSIDDLPADSGLAQRMARAPPGAMAMSVEFGRRFRHEVGGGDRSTWRLPRGNYITFVPTGLVEPDHWDTVIFPELRRHFSTANSQASDQLTRAQRLEARNRRLGRSE